MSEHLRRVIELALKLTPEEQELVVDALLAELEADAHKTVEADTEEADDDVEFSPEQLEEWKRRGDEARANPEQTIDADEAMAQVRARLR